MYQLRPLSELVKLENNPRRITDTDLAKLVQSIRDNQDYFQARPLILSDRTGELVIIAGNQRYEAAKFLELDMVPTYLISGLNKRREQEIIIRDNISNGSWDYDALNNEWNEFDLNDWGVNLAFPSDQTEEPEEQKQVESTKITLDYTYDDYIKVKEALSKINSSPEQAVWKLLFER